MRLFSLALFIASLTVVTACSDAQPETDTASSLQQSINAFRLDTQSDLDRLDAGFDDLEVQMHETGAETRQMLREVLTELRAQRDKLQQDLTRLRDTDEQGFQRQRQVITQRLHDLEAKLEAARFDAVESREAFQHAVETRMGDIKRELATLRRQAEDADDHADVISGETLSSLREQRENIDRQIAQLKDASDTAFRELRSELAWSVARLGSKIDTASERMQQALDDEASASGQASF